MFMVSVANCTNILGHNFTKSIKKSLNIAMVPKAQYIATTTNGLEILIELPHQHGL